MSQPDDGVEWAAHVADVSGAHRGVGIAELDHSTVRDELSDYLDGGLPEAERERLDRHLDGCADCSAYQRTPRRTAGLLGELPRPTAPTGAKDAIVERARG